MRSSPNLCFHCGVAEPLRLSQHWRRLLVEPERLAACAGQLTLSAAESHYLRRVLRLRSGDRLALIDGCGGLWSARLVAATGAASEVVAALEQPLAQPLQRQPAPSPLIALAVALPRQDPDVLLRMVCELGIDRIVTLQAARSVPAARFKSGRAESILREAAEQCERLWLPSLAADQPASTWLAGAEADASAAAAGLPSGLKLLATTRHQGLPSLLDRLGEATGAERPSSVWVAVGPEGGWSPAEEGCAQAAGWTPVSLGETILRTSTAAVTAAAHLAAWRRCRSV